MTLEEFSSLTEELKQSWDKFSAALQNLKFESQSAGPQLENSQLSLNVTLYTDLEPVSPTLSKGRVRIFYKGLNRNRTYISEDFANQLIKSLPYVPVKGIFNKDDVDYEDHGEDNTDGRIYGLVMENPNFAWEDHLDEDGVIRTYACADVIYYTALYPEAKLIPGCSQSMEIWRDNLVGEWKIWPEDGEPYYDFQKGCLLGLQVLGSLVEPCFEGAAFYSLKKDLETLIKYTNTLSEKEESADMEKTLFRLSDNEKAEFIAKALNPNFNEEGNWEMSAVVLDVYDDYALVCDVQNGGYKRAYYTKEGDNVTIGDVVDVYIVDVTATESAALEAMKSVSGTYEAANDAYTAATEKIASLESALEEANSKVEATVENTEEVVDNSLAEETAETVETKEEEATDFAVKISELEATIASKEEELTSAAANYSNLENEKIRVEQEKADLESERDSLLEFKKNVETARKEEILTKYEEHLTDEMVENFKNSIDQYSIEDFEKEVCVAAVKNSPSIFSKTDEPVLVYTGGRDSEMEKGLSGMERILEKHKKGGNK